MNGKTTSLSGTGILKTLAGFAAGALLALSPVAAMAQVGNGNSASVVRVDLSAGGAAQTLALPIGRSAVVELPVDARDVLVSNPAVADAILRTPRRIYVLGVKAGATDAVFFDAGGRRILTLSIRVDQNTSSLAETINRVLPGSHVQVEGINDSVILSGLVANASDADRALSIARATVTKPEQVLDMLSIAGKDQVMLKVRIVEMDRNVIKQLGFNLSAVLGQVGSAQFSIANAAQFAVNGALLGGLSGAGYSLDTTQQPEMQLPCGAGWPAGSLCPAVVKSASQASNYNTATLANTAGSTGLNKAGASIDAFEQVGLVRTLAEPNLTAVSGESAKFLVGGEFPVPTGEDSTGRVSIEFKPYGVGLGFTPVVLSGGRISLKLSTEVSELSNTGSFSLSTGTTSAALVVPSLTVRRAETTVELPSGGALMIAGLLQDKSSQDLDSLPGMMELPILGALFRSRDYQAGQTELVIIVTPYIVSPTSPEKFQTPVDGLQTASDMDTILMGHLNKIYKHPPEATAGRTYQGPYGYVVE